MISDYFIKAKKDGSLLKCKFCNAPIWYDPASRRYYDIGGKTYHVQNCNKRKAYYTHRNKLYVENRKQRRRDSWLQEMDKEECKQRLRNYWLRKR